MRRLMRRALPLAVALWIAPAPAAPAPPVFVVPVEGPIGPATADFVGRSLERAKKDGAQLVVLRMDTPGGLDTSMRAIIKDILASPVPVAAWVAPAGARAASAGTFILYAAHVAAMAPATNLGAASPVAIGGAPEKGEERRKGEERQPTQTETLVRKQTQDAAAYIRGLAQLRGRNAEWAERAVREAVSLSAEEALRQNVIDLIAEDLAQLLGTLDARKLTAGGAERTLATATAAAVTVERDWRTRFLGVLTDPSIAYILVLLGIYALLFEFSNPGLVLPGVVGAICVLLALYAFHLLPVNYAGLALILLGIAFMVGEAFFPAYGSLGIGGLVAFVIGSVILFDAEDVPGFEIPLGLIAGIAAASAGFLVFVLGMLVRGRRRPVVTGREEMIGAVAEVLEDCEREGWARVHGETWRVRAGGPLRRGERVRVTGMHGLVLEVKKEAVGGEGR
ncbi:MAG: nodulation protein NfeD [Burkholderiales bacterium]|nr:nodulation protein NfeD [Burkholderiales bacterium]